MWSVVTSFEGWKLLLSAYWLSKSITSIRGVLIWIYCRLQQCIFKEIPQGKMYLRNVEIQNTRAFILLCFMIHFQSCKVWEYYTMFCRVSDKPSNTIFSHLFLDHISLSQCFNLPPWKWHSHRTELESQLSSEDTQILLQITKQRFNLCDMCF